MEYTDGTITTNAESNPIHIFLYALKPTIVAIIARKTIEQYK